MKYFLITLSTLCILKLNAQTISTFENMNLPPAKDYWNGADYSGGFSSGNAFFNNVYDSAFGGSWSGWAVSRIKDTITPGFNNQYAAMAGSGYDGSVNYAVGYMNTFAGIYPRIQLTGNAKGKMVSGCFVTNSTYAYYDMKNGSGFSKKFGGTAGSDPDYLKMTASGYLNGMKINQKATFYLADFTSQDSTKDYILKEWRWFDLSSLGNVDSIEFTLESSDTGSFGMNTPAYFCMDHFITKDMALTVSATYTSKLALYPNPAHDVIYTTVSGLGYGYNVYQLSGALVSKGTLANGQIDFSGTTAGIYIVETISEQGSQFHKVNIR